MTKLIEKLRNNNLYPLHMPGHKRNPDFVLKPEIWQDITEIQGFDDLAHPCGILKDIEDQAAKLFGAKKTFMSVNGSTASNLAAIRAASLQFNSKSLAVLNGFDDLHRSIYNAADVCNLKLTPQEAKVALITSPTYNGEMWKDYSLVKNYSCVIVDAAHGAHLGFHNYFPQNPTSSGADIVIESLHKTLPVLGQTSLLHICSERIDVDLLKKQLNIFQTSSPSYMLMASIAHCLNLLEKNANELFNNFTRRLKILYNNKKFIFQDPSKLLINAPIGDYLRKNGFEPEREKDNTTLLMFTICDPDWVFEKLKGLLEVYL